MKTVIIVTWVCSIRRPIIKIKTIYIFNIRLKHNDIELSRGV